MKNVLNQKVFILTLTVLIVFAWLSLINLGQSPYGRFINHSDDMIHEDNFMMIIFIVSWTVMTIAMMLPSALPLILMFKLMIKDKNNEYLLIFLLIIGYLSIWLLFGILAHFMDWILHSYIEQDKMLKMNTWLIGTIILIIAGLYQFSSLKYYCLDKCRSPKNFIIKHWQGRNESSQAFIMGIDHGIFCVGCCWSLMILMFLVGIGSIGWMLTLSIIMTIEKNIPIPQSRTFSIVIGILIMFLSFTTIKWSIIT